LKNGKGLEALRAKIGPPQMSIKFSPECIHNMCFSEINTDSGAYMKLWDQKKRIIKFENDLFIVVKNNW
jgi:hypothetical protein